MKINVTEKGSLKIYNGLVSGFSSSNYLEVTPSFNVSSAQNWEMVYKIITSDKITTGQTVCGHTGSSTADPIAITTNTSKHFALTVSSSTSSSFINAVSGTYTMLPNTAYWLKVTFDGSKYVLSYSLDGINFTEDVVKENTKVPYTSNLVLGRQQGDSSEFPFLGTIDLKDCYIKIDGELWWTGMVEGGIKPVRSYALKRRETKYYKEVVTEGETWACFYNSTWGYIYFKKPYSVGDISYSTENLDLANSVSELTYGFLAISTINSNGSVECPFDVLGGGNTFNFTPYLEGDLTGTTTELVESTKDDYDVVKIVDSFYSLIRPKVVVLKNWNQPVLSANDGNDNFSVTHINIATLTDYQAYKAFDYNNSTEWRSGNNPDLRNGTSLAGLRMRFGNTPVNITSLEFTNSTRTPISPVGTFDVYGYPSLTSNERVLLMRYDNTTTSSGTSWYVDLSDNKGFYPEYRIVFVTLNTVNNSTNAIAISEIKITGTYQNISDNSYSLCREKK